ncbi:hypothetical protein NIES2101_34775 [Calothrix sp. HK-06]|nr:hypothetical protein NIES2101_34775 [Calothrix sp. HK-06]
MNPKHLQEFQNSAIDSDIIELNFKSVERTEVLSRLIPDINIASGKVHADAQWRWINHRYQDLGLSGWWASGIDLLTMQPSEWGCFKSDQPRIDQEKSELFLAPQSGIAPKVHKQLIELTPWMAWGITVNLKHIKYEHPSKVQTEIFALWVPARVWQKVALRYNVHLPDDYKNLPLSAFWQWVIDNPGIPIVLTEGAKKAAAILSCGYVALALPGVNGGYRQPKNDFGENDGLPFLINPLKIFAQKGRRIYFCFDADDKQRTVRNVNFALHKTAKLFNAAGCEVKVITWNPLLGKGIDDVLADTGAEQFDELYKNALAFNEWQSLQLKRLTYKPNLVLNQRYLGEIILPASAKLIGLKSPKNTGKTELMKFNTAPVIRSGEKCVLGIVHRVQLGLGTADRLGLSFVTEITGDWVDKEVGKANGFFLCIDSLHALSQARFNPDDYKGCWVILDEVVQLIWHLLTAETDVKKNRVLIIKNLKKLLQNAEKIIIADADLNDAAIDFIRSLVGYDVEPWIVENQYKFENPWKVYEFTDKNASPLIKKLLERLKAGEKHMLCVSGQKHKSKWGSINLEEYFKKKIPGIKILRIDSQSVTNPNHPAFKCTNDLNKILLEGQYDLVIATSTIETGVDIKVNVFDGVWGIFQGIQTTDSVRQHLSRYRLPVPRYVWIKQIGINRVGNGATTVKELIASERKKDKLTIKQLISIGFEETINDDFEPICVSTWAKLGCVINLGMRDYRNQVLNDLKYEGHILLNASETLLMPTPDEAEIVNDQVTEVRDNNYQAYRESVASSDSPTSIELEKLARKQEKTDEERLIEHKGQLENKYLVNVTPELIEKDDNGWYSQVRLHYYFTEGRDYLPDRDKKIMSNALSGGDGHYFLIDTNSNQMGVKIATLDYIGLANLLEGGEFNESHPTIQDIFTKCKNNSWEIKTLLGLDFSKTSKPIELVQRLLQTIGYKMPFLRREGGKGNQKRIYGTPAANFEVNDDGKLIYKGGKAVPISDGREEVFIKWLERDELARQKAVEQKAKLQETPPTPAELAAAQLRALTNWGDCTLNQEEIDAGWELLTLQEQNVLHQIFEDWRQSQEQQPGNTNDSQQAETGADEVFQWTGCQFKLVTNLSLDIQFLQEQYTSLAKWVQGLPSDVLTADSEPTYNGMRRVWVGNAGALKSIPCEWLEFVGYPLQPVAA